MQRTDDIDRAASNGARRAVNFAELMVQGSARMFGIQAAAAVVAVFGALALAVSVATAQGDGNRFRTAINTRADYTPVEEFTPLAASSMCPGEGSGRQAKPFVIPTGYLQQVVAEETDTVGSPPNSGPTEDLWDMNTQNEFGKDAGRYIYRTHEVGAAANLGDPPRAPGGSSVTVTDLKTGVTRVLAERNDWERFDGIAWTPWGTILAAEETITASAKDLQVPQAVGGAHVRALRRPRSALDARPVA
jgi:hypothetical protein